MERNKGHSTNYLLGKTKKWLQIGMVTKWITMVELRGLQAAGRPFVSSLCLIQLTSIWLVVSSHLSEYLINDTSNLFREQRGD